MTEAARSGAYVPLRRVLAGGALALTLSVVSAAAGASGIADAVMRGETEALAALLAQGDVNAPQADGATALHWAAYRDELRTAELLIAAGADPTRANRAGATPLNLACINGSVAMIELLLDAGADPNERFRNGETALMMAARTGRADALRVLLAHGAEVAATEELRGTTALMWAAAYQQPEAVRVLVEHGADVGARSDITPSGRGPYLAPTARSRIVDYFRGVGQAGVALPVDLEETPERIGQRELPESVQLPASVELALAEGEGESEGVGRARPPTGGLTPLVFAAREGDLASARILLEAGADVNQVTEYEWTALLAAVHNRHYRLAERLLEAGADPNIANKGGWTPLYIAVDNRNIEGGDYPTREPDMDDLELIELLLAHGADPNARMSSSTETRTIFTHQWLYEEGATPFLRAAQSGDTVLMQRLLEAGADPSIPTDNMTTPLMVAAGIGWVEGVTNERSAAETVEAVKMLLELGADVNAVDHDGRTALMGAAHKGRPEIIQLLADHGADLAAEDYGSRDSIHLLLGKTWQAIDYADGLVRVGVQAATPQPEAAALLRHLMLEAGLPVPPEGRTIDSICVTELCQ